jgi:riboflavin kinase/FMN adenylyltransferase
MQSKSFADPSFKNVPSVIAIGVFDGLHLGHMSIIDETVRMAREKSAKSVVVTFSTNPKMGSENGVLRNGLQSEADFTEMLTIRGIDYHCVIDFSDDMSKLSGEEFIALLCTSYEVRAMVVGDSFKVGARANSAGPAEINSLLSKYTSSAYLRVIPPVVIDNEVVSSSLIRRCLLTGELDKASRLLGRAYSLDLRSLKATAENLKDASQTRLLYDVRTLGLLLPKAGKYMVEATAEGISLKGEAFVSEDHLALELPVRMTPDGITFLGA